MNVPAPPGLAYSHRRTLFDRGERRIALLDDELWIIEPDGTARTLPFDAITRVRLISAPADGGTRHLLVVRSRKGPTLKLSSHHFRGIADFEDRTAPFAAFASALFARLAEKRPDLRIVSGTHPVAYWGMIGVVGASLLALFVVVLWLGLPAVGVVELIGVALSLPVLVRWMRETRPGRLDPARPPPPFDAI